MKVAKIVAIVVVAYLGVVVAFESLIGSFQPADETTLVLRCASRAMVKRPTTWRCPSRVRNTTESRARTSLESCFEF